MGATKIILIIVLIIALGIGSFYGYSALTTPKILSINIVDATFEPWMENLKTTQVCDMCTKGFYSNDAGEKVCPTPMINGVTVNDCKPHKEILCIGSGIKSNFNLNVKNFKEPIYCKVSSQGEDLTNPFLAYQGNNQIKDSFGNQLDKVYKLKVCCSTKTIESNFVKQLVNPVCSEEFQLEPRCWS